MPYSTTTFSVRNLDPLTQAWLDDSGSASIPTISRMDTCMRALRDGGLLYNGSTGLLRLNLFCGNSITDALKSQISELSEDADDTNHGFDATNFINSGNSGGITAPLSSTDYLETPVSSTDINSTNGSMGVYMLDTLGKPASTWYGLMGSYATLPTRLLGIRYGNSQWQGFWGGGNAGIENAKSTLGPALISTYGYTTAIDLYEGTDDANLVGGTSDNSTYTGNIYVFCVNQSGPVWYSATYQKTRLGGYYIWKGLMTTAQRSSLVTAMDDFQRAMGRIA